MYTYKYTYGNKYTYVKYKTVTIIFITYIIRYWFRKEQ